MITKKVNNEQLLFCIGCLIGIVSFLIIFGWKTLDVTNDSWLLQGTGFTGDLTQHYMGWQFFRKSEWSFPLGLIENLAYPMNISIIYTDSIPILGILFKLLSPILPATFQYFGIWGLLCLTLQGGFSIILLNRFCKNNIICAIGSIFFIISPVMIGRMFFHSALAAHWIILASLYIWCCTKKSFKFKLVFLVILSIISVLTNLYFTPLVLGISFCSLLKDIIDNREYLKSSIILLSEIIITFATMALFGGFYGNVSASMGGLGVFSFNINGFLNPQGSSLFLKTMPTTNPGQIEGFAYLGLGIIILMAVSIFYRFTCEKKSMTFKKNMFTIAPMTIAIVIFTILAISPIVTFGENTLFSIHYPDIINHILSIFRSSGRFIWVVYYILLVWIIATISQNKRFMVSALTLASCLIIQITDISGYLFERHEFFSANQAYNSPLTSPKWEIFSKRYKHIMFYTPIWDIYVDPNIGYTFGQYALKNNLTLNGVYFSRDLSREIDGITLNHFEKLRNGAKRLDTLYIFPTNIPSGEFGLRYETIDGFKVGLPIE